MLVDGETSKQLTKMKSGIQSTMKKSRNRSLWLFGSLFVLGMAVVPALAEETVVTPSLGGFAPVQDDLFSTDSVTSGVEIHGNAAVGNAVVADVTAGGTATGGEAGPVDLGKMAAEDAAEAAADLALEAAAKEKTPEAGASSADASRKDDTAKSSQDDMTLWDFIKKGGVLMYPIGFMSLLVVAIGLERLIALSRRVVLPPRLFSQLEPLLKDKKTDPRQVYKLCEKYPSMASTVIRALLLKAGRPMSEVQTQFQVAKDDEAERLYAKVRWLTLAAAVTPLMGLLGTVLGMSQAFKETAAMSSVVGVNRAEQLSEGIYLALITTCAGLIVAIPAAILAHWYEAKILALFRILDRKLISFFAYMERLEDKVVVTPEQYENYQENRKSGSR